MKKPSLFFYCVVAKNKEREEMTNINRFFKLAHIFNKARIIKNRIETEKNGLAKIIVEIKPYKRDSNRCPICRRKCSGYDTLGKRSKGRPKKEKQDKADMIKGSSFAVGKTSENLTLRQKETLNTIKTMTPRYYRAYDMKEALRLILKMNDYENAKDSLKKWRWRASHSRIESFKELAEKIKRNEEFILNTIRYGFSNARIEATNNKIKLIIRRSYGFKKITNMLDMIYLCCSSLVIPLPGRHYEYKKTS